MRRPSLARGDGFADQIHGADDGPFEQRAADFRRGAAGVALDAVLAIAMFPWAPIPEPYRAAGSLEFSKTLVTVSLGIGFGPMGEGFVRFSFIENSQGIRQATIAIKKILKW